ncbi:hypothetical protein PAXRUDRAFT_145721 [Paxillus rubicundulus Ve08.2h10]|uniref:Uncharacterized protein n=1 Tax=Paxillus rubicundulus Ve08.2h10 TaxID=930991 RepID=A0A0D0D859_9AGAM|nr:hypothetical protein PAXRUDRAFT_145721 [Paxillus rubicundulus Ve08.2h10]
MGVKAVETKSAVTEATLHQGMEMCKKLERLYLQYAEGEGLEASHLQCHLQWLQAHLRKVKLDSLVQITYSSL